MGSSCLKEIHQSFVINIHLFVMVIMVDLLAKKQNMILFQMECYPKVEILGDTFEPFDIWLAYQIRIGALTTCDQAALAQPPSASCPLCQDHQKCLWRIRQRRNGRWQSRSIHGSEMLALQLVYLGTHLHYLSIDIYILLYHYIHICQLDIVKYSTDGKDFKHICPDRQISLTGGYRYPRNCTVR